jgi:class 4 POU domain transcription factor
LLDGKLQIRIKCEFRIYFGLFFHFVSNKNKSFNFLILQQQTNLNNVFGGIEDSLFARAEALADISKATHLNMAKQQDNLYMAAAAAAASNHPSTITNHLHHSMSRHSFNDNTPADHQDHHHQQMLHQQQQMNHRFTPNSMAESAANSNPFYNFYHHSSMGSPQSSNHSHQLSQHSAAAIAAAAAISQHSEIDIDPRELETFAEKFKQRRIKLGVTQADVGQQLSKLKLPGVGSLSQSTICRFESLTLSHNNMIALKPVLHSWLEQAESDARNKRKNEEVMSTSSLTNSSSVSSVSLNSNSNLDRDRKRKRTSIAAPEKRSLEAFFSVQPRPSGEKIAQIAEKLDLKKNVVRVWFCNQRQKQKRMKFAAIQGR